MAPSTRVLVIAAGAIIVFDALASLASRLIGFSYAAASPIEFLIYATVGFFAARGASVPAGIGAGATIALVDATIGWAVSWLVGPGRPPDGYKGVAPLLITVAVVTITGAVFGLIGAGIARFVPARG